MLLFPNSLAAAKHNKKPLCFKHVWEAIITGTFLRCAIWWFHGGHYTLFSSTKRFLRNNFHQSLSLLSYLFEQNRFLSRNEVSAEGHNLFVVRPKCLDHIAIFVFLAPFFESALAWDFLSMVWVRAISHKTACVTMSTNTGKKKQKASFCEQSSCFHEILPWTELFTYSCDFKNVHGM